MSLASSRRARKVAMTKVKVKLFWKREEKVKELWEWRWRRMDCMRSETVMDSSWIWPTNILSERRWRTLLKACQRSSLSMFLRGLGSGSIW